MADKFLKLEQLTRYNNKLKETYATKAEATGGDLSAYALKTELPDKATTETEGIVKPDGTSITVDDGTISATPPDLSAYAKITQIPGVATDDTAGIVKPDGSTITVGPDGTLSASADTSLLATKAELADYAKSTQVATDIQSAKTELEGEINSKIASVYKAKGDSTFAELPTPSADTVGDVYNVTDAFVTDDKFAVQSQSYPAGTNVVVVDAGEETYKYDALSGVIDTSAFMQKTDITSITDDEIDALFTV